MSEPPLPRKVAPRRRYRLYIDETGSHGASPKGGDGDRYLCLLGCAVPRDTYISTMDPALRDIKQRYFGSDSIVLHRHEVEVRDPPFSALKDRKVRDAFNREMVGFYQAHEYALFAVAIDKDAHFKRWKTAAYHPYHYCAKLMIERYCFFLQSVGGVGDAAVESRGKSNDATLAAEWMRYYRGGTDYIDAQRIQWCLNDGVLVPKSKHDNCTGLQLSDMLALPALDMILAENGRKSAGLTWARGYVQRAIEPKFYRRSENAVVGCGRVLLK